MSVRLTPETIRLRAILERNFQQSVVRYAKKHGWSVVSFHASIVNDSEGEPIYATAISGDAKGFPDLSLYRPGDQPIYAELKRELGRLRPDQVIWLGRLRDCGQIAVVWRPSDMPAIRRILA